MSDIPEGAIPVDQFEAATPAPEVANTQAQGIPEGAIPIDQFESQEDTYGGGLNQLKAGVEGVAEGIAGPLAPLAETKLLGVNPEDIRGRQEANPWTHGIGQTAGLAGGLLTGTGDAAVMTKAGELAAGALGLGDVASSASLGYKVGSSAVKQAAEMAVLQSGDEASKQIMQDPDASAQSALANIGLAAAIGGVGGAFITGAVSPLWEATAGPKVEEMLSGLKNRLNGTAAVLPDQLNSAVDTLGIEISPATRAALSGDPKAAQMFNELRESQHPEILQDIANLRKSSSDSVLKSLGIAPETVEHYSENEAGHGLYDTFEKEYRQKYEPIAKSLEERNAVASTISVPDEARMGQYGQIIEKGMNSFGTDSPLFKQYQDWGNRLLAKETIGGMDMLKTEIGGELKKAYRSGDSNMIKALNEIKGSIHDFQETQITKQAAQLEAQGASSAKAVGKDLINQRADINRQYAEFAKMSGDLASHLGVGEFRGFGSLTNKLEDKVSAEQLLRKFSPKNNADIIPFLQQHFPETLEAVRQNELAQIIKPSVLGAKGQEAIDMAKLSKAVANGLAGKADYMKWAMNPEAISKIQAADTLQRAIPNFKSSGTAGWQQKLMTWPASAMAGVGMLMGHNPVAGALIGHASKIMGVDAPQGIKYGLLKFMGSEQPVKSEGFKAMVDFIHNSIKGQTLIAKATSNVLKAGAQVLTESQMPNKADREKLDKVVEKYQENPEMLMRLGSGHTGHYMPEHQTAMAAASTAALQHLQQLRPQPHQSGPLNKPLPVLPQQQARYDRALDIAQQPAMILHHVKAGTLQSSDIVDMKAMYPALYNHMSQSLLHIVNNRHADSEPIPYRARMSISMMLGQPLDSSMSPTSIMAAQPQPPPPASQGGGARPAKMDKKAANSYKTPGQAAESDRSSRE